MEEKDHYVCPQGRYMKGKNQITVEPVFGTLTQFMGLRKINSLGLSQASRCMQLSAIAYNIKKYLEFSGKRTKSGAGMIDLFFVLKNRPTAVDKSVLTGMNLV